MATLPEDITGTETDGVSAERDTQQPDHAKETALRTASTAGKQAIESLVAEIRRRTAELASRELAMQQREQELDQQYRLLVKEAREAAQQEWADAQDRLSRRSAELDEQAVEMAARSSRFEQFNQRLSERELALEQTQKDISQQVNRLRRRTEAIQKQRIEEQQSLRRRIGVIREREKELERRIGRAHGDIIYQRQDLEEKRSTLQKRVVELEKHELDLQARKEVLEQEVAELQARSGELSKKHAEMRAARAEIENQRHELEQIARKLESEQQEFSKKQQDFDTRWRSTRLQRHDIARQMEELDARRRKAAELESTSKQRLERLEHYEQQLKGRATGLEAESQRLAEFEQELERRKKSINTLVEQSEQAAREAENHNEELLRLRERAETREAENRQAQLALELEQEELDRERAALRQAQQTLDGRQARRETELEQVRITLGEQMEQLRRADRSLLSQPRHLWLRSSILAVTIGLLAGLAWYTIERPLYSANGEIRLINSEAANRNQLVRLHEQRLNTPAVIEQILENTDLLSVWQAARRDSRVQISPIVELGTIRISVETAEVEPARRLIEAISNGYRELATSWPEEPQALAALSELQEERKRIPGELKELQQQREEHQKRLESLPRESERDELRSAVEQVRIDYDELGRSLAEDRAALIGLESGPVPRGNVLPAKYEDALAADEMYQQDLTEFRTNAVQYRSELVVALLLVVDPVRDLQAILKGFNQTVAEQRELQPPAAVEAALEQCSVDVVAFGEVLASFANQWNNSLDALQELQPEREMIELITLQNVAADAARKVCAQAKVLSDGIRNRLDQLGANIDGGTREVVVAAVLRSELGKLSEAVTTLVQTADNTDLSNNVHLDALDRQLRGLRTRLDRRQTSVRQMLQFDADEQARRRHVEQISELRRTVQGFEEQRETLIGELSTKLDELRLLDAEVAQRQEVEAAIRRCKSDQSELLRKLADLNQRVAALEPDGPITSLEVGPVLVKTIAGVDRQLNTGLVGLGAMFLTYALCLLMVVKNPLRRSYAWEQAVNELTVTAEPDCQSDAANETDS